MASFQSESQASCWFVAETVLDGPIVRGLGVTNFITTRSTLQREVPHIGERLGMAASQLQFDYSPEPDLHPLYPAPASIAPLLCQNSGLTPSQKSKLVAHCLTRACVFGDLSVLSYLITDRHAQAYVDLGIRDEDGVGLISLAIHGFGAESERDVEREECVRLLIAQGADIGPDNGVKYSTLPSSIELTC